MTLRDFTRGCAVVALLLLVLFLLGAFVPYFAGLLSGGA